MKTLTLPLAFSLAATIYAGTSLAEEPPCPFYENRSGLCGYYHSEISPAEAYLDTVVNRGKKNKHDNKDKHGKKDKRYRQAVILDVRSIPEFSAGHPEYSYNVPYPYIYQECNADGRTPDGACKSGKIAEIPQDPVEFVNYVQRLIPDKDTPIYTLCRTGVRSVGAGNLLADAGYTQVRNIWEGFVGVNLTAPKKQADGTTKTLPVDLNHDGVLNDLDKNGWVYHQALPYEVRLHRRHIYLPYDYLYEAQ